MAKSIRDLTEAEELTLADLEVEDLEQIQMDVTNARKGWKAVGDAVMAELDRRAVRARVERMGDTERHQLLEQLHGIASEERVFSGGVAE